MQELYQKAKKGDQAAESELFRRLFVRFRLFAEQQVDGLEAADVAQAACIAIHGKYREEAITKTFDAWAYGVFRNMLLKAHERGRRDRDRQEKLMEFAPAEEAMIDESFLIDELRDCMRRLADSFRRYGRIVNLRYQGYSTDEVCRRLSISREQYYVYLGRGRSMLRACLNEKGIEI
jgi:RNA polymerase sigma factor (sigma-70 family)